MELKEELDAFVNASLAEYAKLFLEPGAEVSRHDLQGEQTRFVAFICNERIR